MNIIRKVTISKNKVGISTLDQIKKPNKRPRMMHYELATNRSHQKKETHKTDIAV